MAVHSTTFYLSSVVLCKYQRKKCFYKEEERREKQQDGVKEFQALCTSTTV